MSSVDERLYQIACSFVALKRKGLESGDIPGIGPQAFYDQTLAEFIYHGPGGCWSSSEILLLEFLLNLYNPTFYPQFNLGEALYVMDPVHMKALLNAMARFYSGT